MRTKLAVTGAIGFGVALALGYVWVAVLIFVGYVAWTWIRIPLERRDRLRQVDPSWHRHVRYHHDGSHDDGED